MKSPSQFIVSPLNKRRYNNSKKIGGKDIIVSTSQEDVSFSNREAEVIELPLNYKGEIKKGDTLLVHHNVFKYYYDMRGRQKSGKSFLKDDYFLVDMEQFFLYKQNNEWKTYGRYCFVKPIPKTESIIFKNTNNEPLMGEMVYVNEYLKSKGLIKGDKVSFVPDSEYEFRIDNEKLYRMFDHQITIKL
jgi:hypothetical protein|tara:strand:- start:474 stop:1037 length:564 start_codon:yes stop_codon:yes gene_type:complete